MPEWKPKNPNILITGTPGTGKTTLSQKLAEKLELRYINIGEFASEHKLIESWDPTFQCNILDEDKVLDLLEPIMTEGGIIIDHHSCDWFPERWFHVAVVLQATTETLYERLEARKYPENKIRENIEAEIMQVCYEEAVESYPKLKVSHLHNDRKDQLKENVKLVRKLYEKLLSDWK